MDRTSRPERLEDGDSPLDIGLRRSHAGPQIGRDVGACRGRFGAQYQRPSAGGDPLARLLISGEVTDGGSVVVDDYDTSEAILHRGHGFRGTIVVPVWAGGGPNVVLIGALTHGPLTPEQAEAATLLAQQASRALERARSYEADRETADKHGRLRVPPAGEPRRPGEPDDSYVLRRIWLSAEEERGYYYGFANEGLWPLCHIAHTRPVFRHGDWVQYRSVNEKFARAVLEEVDSDDPIVLVQDYHFALAPALLREKLPRATVLMFWHIPWPNPDRLLICQWWRELVSGLLANDHLGVPTATLTRFGGGSNSRLESSKRRSESSHTAKWGAGISVFLPFFQVYFTSLRMTCPSSGGMNSTISYLPSKNLRVKGTLRALMPSPMTDPGSAFSGVSAGGSCASSVKSRARFSSTVSSACCAAASAFAAFAARAFAMRSIASVSLMFLLCVDGVVPLFAVSGLALGDGRLRSVRVLLHRERSGLGSHAK